MVSCNHKVSEKSLHIALLTDTFHFDPARTYDLSHNQINYQIYETLLKYQKNGDRFELKPFLAESMPDISEDGKTYLFKIKKNIPYHPSSYLDKKQVVVARDFINAIKRVLLPDSQSQGKWLLEGVVQGADTWLKDVEKGADPWKTEISGLQEISEDSFKIHLNYKKDSFIYFFAMLFSSPIPSKILDSKMNLVDFFSKNEVGTGLYTLDTFLFQTSTSLKKVRSHREQALNNIDSIKFLIMKEASTRWLSFRAKKISYIEIPKDSFSQVLKEDGTLIDEYAKLNFKLKIAPSYNSWWLSFNMNDPVWGKNVNLRKAIATAINVKEMNKLFYNNTGIVAHDIFPAHLRKSNSKNEEEYSLELAKNLLAKAGYKDGKKLKPLVLDTRSDTIFYRQQAEFIKMQLAKIGITVEININSFAQFMDKARKGRMVFWQDGWLMDYPNEENILSLLYGPHHYPGPNKSGYNVLEFNQAYEKLIKSSDKVEQENLLSKMNQQVVADRPWIMLFYAAHVILAQPEIENLNYSEMDNNFIKDITYGK